MKVIETIKHIKASGAFKKYIDFIQFPFYRNVDLDTRINFDFPLTIFTGQNGCGKSSALHALWGMPEGNTPYRFWFDTKVDPIEYFGDKKRRHAFWYSFVDEFGTSKEVVKTRIKRSGDPNYWETSRPIKDYGMKLLGGSRNKPIQKPSLYLDFRSELSAFDQFFYFGSVIGNKSRNRQEYIRRQSSKLKNLLDGTKTIQYAGNPGKAQNEPLVQLNQKELKAVSFILGRSYTEGQIITHTLYRNIGYSVYLKSTFANYSEAFAGSGEVAVVRLVTEVMKAPNYSLILLDEPEVSLHPGAQFRLQQFLLEQIKVKKHQVILNTHSPSLIQGLPLEAIKVFYQNPTNNKFSIKENVYPEEAFFHIEYEFHKRPIYVEDKLAKYITEAVLKEKGEDTFNSFNIDYHPGGAEVITNQIIPHLSRNSNPNDFVIFDGDQNSGVLFDWKSLSTNELTIEKLEESIKNVVGSRIKFYTDGNSGEGREDQKLELQKAYLDFYLNNTFYFPSATPEEMIWNQQFADELLTSLGIDTQTKLAIYQESNFKEKFSKLSMAFSNANDSESIFRLQTTFVKKFMESKPTKYNEFILVIDKIIEEANKNDAA